MPWEPQLPHLRGRRKILKGKWTGLDPSVQCQALHTHTLPCSFTADHWEPHKEGITGQVQEWAKGHAVLHERGRWAQLEPDPPTPKCPSAKSWGWRPLWLSVSFSTMEQLSEEELTRAPRPRLSAGPS